MPIVVNTNSAATTASFNLSKNAEALRKSLARLSSGKRITNPAEDAGGMAVAYKLSSHARRTEAVLNNHQNALSYLQVQDGALETVGKVVNRMAELRTMAADITKNTSDVENYSKEFRELQSQLSQIQREKFNGISLFAISSGATNQGTLNTKAENDFEFLDQTGATHAATVDYKSFSRELLTHPSGLSNDGSISLNVTNLTFVLSIGNMAGGVTGANLLGDKNTGTGITDNIIDDISSVSIFQFTHVIEKIADARAENGAEQQRIQQSYELHQTNLVNIEAAHGRIMDVDVALESTRFAKNNVLVQASASMTAQANQLSNIALTLLQ